MLQENYINARKRETKKETTTRVASYFNSRKKFHPILQFDNVQFSRFLENLDTKVQKITLHKIRPLKNIFLKNFHPIGRILIFAPKICIMIIIRYETYEGMLLSWEDSKLYIEFTIRREFKNLSDFLNCKEIQFSDYWGDVQLMGAEDEYYTWIVQTAKRILND
jgi:hypothetical protein